MKLSIKLLNISLVISVFSLLLLLSSNVFAKKTTQATCGLGSGGGVLGTNFKYQVISDYTPFKVAVLSRKTKNSTGEYLQQYERIINFELTSYPTSNTEGSQFAIISIEDSNPL